MERFSLSMLEPHRSCVVTSVSGGMEKRLREIGVTEGTRLTWLFDAPCGDPVAYSVRGAVIALRKSDASDIIVAHAMR